MTRSRYRIELEGHVAHLNEDGAPSGHHIPSEEMDVIFDALADQLYHGISPGPKVQIDVYMEADRTLGTAVTTFDIYVDTSDEPKVYSVELSEPAVICIIRALTQQEFNPLVTEVGREAYNEALDELYSQLSDEDDIEDEDEDND
jgi:hypothetical protein